MEAALREKKLKEGARVSKKISKKNVTHSQTAVGEAVTKTRKGHGKRSGRAERRGGNSS